jgi:hypothetical protein
MLATQNTMLCVKAQTNRKISIEPLIKKITAEHSKKFKSAKFF